MITENYECFANRKKRIEIFDKKKRKKESKRKWNNMGVWGRERESVRFFIEAISRVIARISLHFKVRKRKREGEKEERIKEYWKMRK